MKQKQQISPLINSKQLAQNLGVSLAWVKKAKAKYGLPCMKIGRNLRFDMDRVNDWIKEQNNKKKAS